MAASPDMALTTVSYDLVAADIIDFLLGSDTAPLRSAGASRGLLVRYLAAYLAHAHQRGEIEGMARYDRILSEVTSHMTSGAAPVSCSQCGRSFVLPGRRHGFSRCIDHPHVGSIRHA